MTNEERINLRERALRLAYEFPIENTGTNQSWADDIYDYLVKDIDPAEISEPEKSRNEWKHVSEISPSEYQRIHADLHGIDWSRPQLVVSEDDDEFIVRTTGLHGFDEFQGYSDEDGDIPDWYKKKRFKYSGEIPQEQKTEGLNFLEAITACKSGKNVARKWWVGVYHIFMYHSDMKLYWQDGEEVELDMESYLATDWQIVK